MKRFITCLLVAVLLVASFATAAMAATVGETVTVEIKAEKNPGFAAYQIVLSFDADALELKKVEKGALSGGNLDVNYNKNSVAYMGDESTGDGVLFTATFLVKEGTKPGTYPVTGSLVDAYNENLDEVSFTVVGADVVVECDHKWSAWTTTKTADCENAGEQARTCSACGEKETKVIPALGHKPGAAVKEKEIAPDCIKEGSYDEVVYCTVCKEELSRKTVNVPALGHKPGAEVIENKVDGDCVTDSSYDKVVYCTVCKEELSRETVTVKAPGHQVSKDYANDDKGHYHYCEVCGEQVGDAEAHKGGKWVCTDETHMKSCSVCGFVMVEGSHDFDEKGVCKTCGYDSNKDPVPPTGDITPVIVTTAFGMVAAIAAAAYMLKRKFNV